MTPDQILAIIGFNYVEFTAGIRHSHNSNTRSYETKEQNMAYDLGRQLAFMCSAGLEA